MPGRRTDNVLSIFLTKVTRGPRRRRLVRYVLYDIYDYHNQRQDQPRYSSPPDLEGTEEICLDGGQTMPGRRADHARTIVGVRHEKALRLRESSVHSRM